MNIYTALHLQQFPGLARVLLEPTNIAPPTFLNSVCTAAFFYSSPPILTESANLQLIVKANRIADVCNSFRFTNHDIDPLLYFKISV